MTEDDDDAASQAAMRPAIDDDVAEEAAASGPAHTMGEHASIAAPSAALFGARLQPHSLHWRGVRACRAAHRSHESALAP